MTLDTVGMSEFSVRFISDHEHARCIVNHMDIKNKDILIEKMRLSQKRNQMRITLRKSGIELRLVFLYWAYPNIFTEEFPPPLANPSLK
jgi:hypothetical protein